MSSQGTSPISLLMKTLRMETMFGCLSFCHESAICFPASDTCLMFSTWRRTYIVPSAELSQRYADVGKPSVGETLGRAFAWSSRRTREWYR